MAPRDPSTASQRIPFATIRTGWVSLALMLCVSACGGTATPPPADPPMTSKRVVKPDVRGAGERSSGARTAGKGKAKTGGNGGKASSKGKGRAKPKDLAGKWRVVEIPAAPTDLSEEEAAMLAELEAIGYADGNREVTGARVVTVHDAERADNGLNLWCSGHAPAVYLTDMQGTVLHTWQADWDTVFPDSKVRMGTSGTHHYRRAHLAEDGHMYVIFEGKGIAKLAPDSTVVWAKENRAHHDVALLDNGGVLSLARALRVLPEVHPTAVVTEDWVQELDAEGQAVRSVSVTAALLASEWGDTFREQLKPRKERDLLHTNSLELLDGSLEALNPAFKKGRVLVSFRSIHMIAVLDMDSEQIVWAHTGAYRAQHDPTVTSAKQLMVFDNGGGGRKISHVRVYDPATMEEVWTFSGSEEVPFRSGTLGTAQLLSNGNVLVTESDGGRAIELTPDQEIVWEFYNPHRAGEDGRFIAALFEVVRLPMDLPRPWAAGP